MSSSGRHIDLSINQHTGNTAVTTPPSFAARLEDAIQSVHSPVAVGLDPTPKVLPKQLLPTSSEPTDWADAYLRYCKTVLDVCRPHAAVTKLQVAFFEVLGARGIRVFEQCMEHARQLGYLVISDVKRNDIGHTATAYATTYLGGSTSWVSDLPLADAITVTPIFGDDGNQPFLTAAEENGRESSSSYAPRILVPHNSRV